MTVTHNLTPATSDPIAAHRYVRPIVREISPLTAAPSGSASNPRPSKRGAGALTDVVAAAAAGDPRAVTTLVDRFGGRIRRVARAHGLPAYDVEDVVQTTWLRLLQNGHKILNPNGIGAWLETTARRESLRLIRASKREYPTDNIEVFDTPVAPVEVPALPSPERCAAALAVALEQLTGQQRVLISTLFSDPMPRYGEVSRALGVPIGSIGPTRARALTRLRENEDLRVLAQECLLDAL